MRFVAKVMRAEIHQREIIFGSGSDLSKHNNNKQGRTVFAQRWKYELQISSWNCKVLQSFLFLQIAKWLDQAAKQKSLTGGYNNLRSPIPVALFTRGFLGITTTLIPCAKVHVVNFHYTVSMKFWELGFLALPSKTKVPVSLVSNLLTRYFDSPFTLG